MCSVGIGVFQEYYQNDLLKQHSPSTVSWIPSFQIFFMLGLVSFSPGMLTVVVTDHCHPPRDHSSAPYTTTMGRGGLS